MPRGRKPIPNAKHAHIVVRFQDVELNAIRDHANKQGQPISTFIRSATLQYLESINVPTTLSPDNPNQLRIDTD